MTGGNWATFIHWMPVVNLHRSLQFLTAVRSVADRDRKTQADFGDTHALRRHRGWSASTCPNAQGCLRHVRVDPLDVSPGQQHAVTDTQSAPRDYRCEFLRLNTSRIQQRLVLRIFYERMGPTAAMPAPRFYRRTTYLAAASAMALKTGSSLFPSPDNPNGASTVEGFWYAILTALPSCITVMRSGTARKPSGFVL